jgi:hypothetical protein
VTGKPVIADAMTTATEQTAANPDGTLTLKLSNLPRRARRNGLWVDLDASLVRNSDGSYSPAATTTGLTLSGGGSAPLAVMTGTEGRRLALSWPGTLPTPTVAGDTATYPAVFTGVDLVVKATPQGGFSDVLVVHNAAAAANPALAHLHLSAATTGLTWSADAAGNLAASDASGAAVFTAPAPLLWDSAAPPARVGAPHMQAQQAIVTDGAPAASTVDSPGAGAMVTPITATVSGATLTLAPPAAALTAASNVYPLFIDPTFNSTAPGRNAWTYVNSYYHTTKYWNSTDVARAGYAGWESPFYVARSFFMFPIPSSIWDTHVHSATLQTQETWSSNNTQYWIDVNHISTSPTAINSSTDWDHQPAKGGLINRQDAVGNWDSRGEAYVSPKEQDFDVTGEIASAAAGHWSSDTIGLYNETETDKYGWRKFQSNPVIAITYNSVPPQPTGAATSPQTFCPGSGNTIGNTEVAFAATVSDPDGTQNPLTATFTITDTTAGTSATPSQTVSSGQTARVFEPAGFFHNGHSYSWTVSVSDGIDTGASTAPCTFTVDQTTPAAPTVRSPYDAVPVTPLAPRAQTTFTFSDPGQNPQYYFWALNVIPPHLPPSQTTEMPGWHRVPATTNGADTSIPIIPSGTGPNTLYVYAANSSGNPSTVAHYDFAVAPLASPDRYGDFTGDGVPDLLVVGPVSNPGLWLYPGTDSAGHVQTTGIQVGGLGTGFLNSNGNAGDWIGTTVTVGDFTGDGAQDVLVKFPYANVNSSNLELLRGRGDGSTFDPNRRIPIDLGNVVAGQQDQMVDGIAAVADSQISPDIWASQGIAPLPDLYAVVAGKLYLYAPSLPPGQFTYSDQVGTADWTGKDITATISPDGPAFFSRNTGSGSLDEWVGSWYDTVADSRGVPAGADTSSHHVYAASGFNPASTPTIAGADINHDGNADLWAVTGTGVLNAYLNNGANGFGTPATNAALTYAGNPAGFFQPLHQTRILDTRDGTGRGGVTTPVAGNGTITVRIAGVNGVPSSGITAVGLTLTVVAPSNVGFITAYPDQFPLPQTSNLNYATGTTASNYIIVPVGPDGNINLYNTGPAAVIMLADMSGYFTTDSAKAGDSTYTPITPTRFLDTRYGVGAPAGQVAAGGVVSLTVGGAHGIPAANLAAVVVNLTTLNEAAASFLVAYADGTTASGSNLQYGSSIVAGSVIVPVGANGKVDIWTGARTDILADVAGYFTTGTAGMKYHTVTATRMADTRLTSGPLASGGVLPINQGSLSPQANPALVTNVTITQPASIGYMTNYADGTAVPGTSNVSFNAGQTIANLVVAPTGADGSTDYFNASPGSLHVIIDCLGYFADN